MFRKRLLITAVLLFAVCSGAVSAEKLSYIDLIKRLTDLEALSVLPQSGEKCAQWSSWDRSSVYDEAAGKYAKWDANGDNNGMIKQEGESFVMAEMTGPGCIWRIWSAKAGAGHVKIYLDGAAEPAVDLPFESYFDHSSYPFIYPSLVHVTARGLNSYVPISYQKSCKIVADKDWGAYYHFTYTTFPEGTQVPTFKRELSSDEKAALESADAFLSKRLGTDPAGNRPGQETMTSQMTLTAGETKAIASIDGPGAVTGIWVKLDSETLKNPEKALRDVVLRIRWDDEKDPSVWVPLGDFFGSGPGLNKYSSLPLGVTDDGFYCYWYMPFAKNARVDLINEGSEPFSGRVWITHAPLARPVEQLGRFHAKWHRDAYLPKEPERWIDWPMVKTEGSGRFVGVMLEVWNPRGSWWGEGDEKFFVDGEKFPSTFGTGSEDYFGYAWCSPELFQNAYHNQTRCNGNVGHISVNRWHVTDNIPFQKSFEGNIEKYFLNNRPTLYACTAYWYLQPDGSDPYGPVPVKDRYFYTKADVFKVKGAIEGEHLKVLDKTGGKVSKQFLPDRWSSDWQLWWTEAKPGDKLDCALPVKEAGVYTLKARFTQAKDYGIVQFYIDGQKAGKPVDLFSKNVKPSDEIGFGSFQLASGEHKLTVEILGANEKAVKSYMFGLDYLKLDK